MGLRHSLCCFLASAWAVTAFASQEPPVQSDQQVKTTLTQRLILSGDNSSAHVEQVRSAFGPNLAAGMTRLAATMTRAERGGGR